MRCSAHTARRAGFTLVELLVVIVILAILVGMLMPAVQMAREAARKSTCGNNLKQIGIALNAYEATYKKFPYGNLQFGSGGPSSYGHSWWARILPYLELGNIADNYNWIDPAMGELPNNTHNFQLLRNVEIPLMVCPSSPLPKTGMLDAFGGESTGPVQMAQYAGIAGSSVSEERVTSSDKIKSYGGMLTDVLVTGSGTLGGVTPAGSTGGYQVSRAQIRDGATCTMIVAEQSNWCYDAAGAPVDCRVRGLMGVKGVFVNGACCAGSEGINDSNITVRYAINYQDASAPGIRNPNTPILSAHRDGANVLMVGGNVHFLTGRVELDVLYLLADRDDGQSVDVGGL